MCCDSDYFYLVGLIDQLESSLQDIACELANNRKSICKLLVGRKVKFITIKQYGEYGEIIEGSGLRDLQVNVSGKTQDVYLEEIELV